MNDKDDKESTKELALDIMQLIVGHIILNIMLVIETILVAWMVLKLNGIELEWKYALSAILVAWLIKQWCRSEVKLKK